MAKQNQAQGTLVAAGKSEAPGKELATNVDAPAAIAVVSDPSLCGGLDVVGDEKSAIELLPRAAVYYGTPEEEKQYPLAVSEKWSRGDLVIVGEKRRAASNVIVPIVGSVSFVRWDDGQKVPTYVHRTLAECPAADRVFGADGTPPVAQKTVSMVVLIEGEPGPVFLVFKSSALKAYESLRVFENSRRISGRSVGAYKASTYSDTNRKGDVYHRMVLTPIGDIPVSMHEMFRSLRSASAQAALKAQVVKVEATGGADDGTIDASVIDDDAGGGGDGIPF